MSKITKKKSNHPSVLNSLIKPLIQDDRVLITVVGAVVAGVILHYVMGTAKADNLLNKVTTTIKALRQPIAKVHKEDTFAHNNQSVKLGKTPKSKKSAKPFATEHRRVEENN